MVTCIILFHLISSHGRCLTMGFSFNGPRGRDCHPATTIRFIDRRLPFKLLDDSKLSLQREDNIVGENSLKKLIEKPALAIIDFISIILFASVGKASPFT